MSVFIGAVFPKNAQLLCGMGRFGEVLRRFREVIPGRFGEVLGGVWEG